jgi:PAS domain S-box-containing protein
MSRTPDSYRQKAEASEGLPVSAKVAEDLRDSEVRYRRLFEAAKDGILILDARTGKVIDVNPFLIDLLGFPREHFTQRKVWELGFIADIVANKADFVELQRKEYVRYEDKPLKAADGRRIDVEFVSHVYEEDHHKVIQCNIRDITDRKRAEATVQDSERRYRMFFEWSPTVLCEVDLTGLLRMGAQQKGGLDETLRILKDRWAEARDGIRLTGMNAAARKVFGIAPSPSAPDASMPATEEVLAGLLASDMKCIISGKAACKGESYLDMGGDSRRIVEWCWARSPGPDGSDVFLVSLVDITARKQAEESLLASEGLYRSLVENVHLGINLIDRDHRILKVNSTTCELFHKPSVAFVGKRCFKEFEKREQVCSHCPGTVALATNQPAVCESEVVRDDGSRSWVRLQAFPVLDTDGQAEAFIEVVEDITDRKRSEEALKESEDKYRQIFTTETDGIFLIDAQTHRFLDVNEAACRMYGYAREEFLNLHHMDITAQPEESAESITEVIREKRVFVGLRYHRKKDGTVFPVEISGSSFVLHGQSVICAVIRDITQRKRAEDALRESEERLRMAAEAASVGTYSYDHATNIGNYSAEFLALYGLKPSDLLSLRPDMVPLAVLEEDRPAFLAARGAANDPMGDGQMSVEFRIRRPDGDVHWLMARGKTSFTGSPGSRCPAHAAGVVIDITDRKQAQERHSMILKTAMDGFWGVDAQGRILEVNDAFCQITGYGREELLKMSIRDLEAVETPEEVVDHIRRNIAAGSARFEARQRRKDGRIIDVEISVTYLGDASKLLCSFVRDITERKQAEEALRESEAALVEAQRIANVGSWEWDMSSDNLTWSDQLYRMFGQDRESFFPTHEWFLNHLAPEDRHRAENAVRDAVAGRRPYHMEVSVATGKGVSLVILTQGEVKFDAQGRALSMIGTALDITDRKRAEDAMRESETRYRSLFENMVEGFAYCQMIFDHDRPVDFVYLAVNNAFETLTGLKNVVGRKGSEVMPGIRESDAKVIETYGRVARTGKPERIEIYVHVLAMWFSISLYSPKEDHFVAVFDVITERKRLEEERDRLVAILEATSDYVGFADAGDLHICYANLAGRKMVGFGSDEDLTNIKIPDIHPDWANKIHLETILPAVRRDGIWSGESAFLHRDGHEIPVLMVSLAHKDSSGKVKYFSTISRDITQLRKTEAQLRQAQKMEAVGQLAGGVAHDFRNQLTVIKGYAEMLLRRDLVNDGAMEYVQEILKAADRSATISGQLLAFSRQQVLRPEVVCLDALAGDMMKSLATALGEDIRLSIMPRGDLWNVCLDIGQFQQALLNLVLNARDAMPKGGLLKIETNNILLNESFVRQHAGASVGRYAVLTVRDNGIGMSPDTLSHLFEPFFTTKPVGEGTGLGLAMVHGFVTQSGGFIEVKSQPRHGTAFRLYFPAVEDVVEESAGAASQADDLPQGSGTILVVEDEAGIRRMLQETLRECGYTVLPVGNAQDAMPLILAARQKIDLLITDVVMPGWSGPEVAKHFRAVRHGVPVLLISGHAGKTLAGHGVIPADVNLLVKPFTSQTLARTVRDALAGPCDPDNARAKNVPKPKRNTGGKKMKD